MEDIVNSLKKDYARFLNLTHEYKFKENMMESFLLAVISIISIIISFLSEKALNFLFPSLKAHKDQTLHSTVEHNFLIKENSQQISLLKELNFCKAFYTPF